MVIPVAGRSDRLHADGSAGRAAGARTSRRPGRRRAPPRARVVARVPVRAPHVPAAGGRGRGRAGHVASRAAEARHLSRRVVVSELALHDRPLRMSPEATAPRRRAGGLGGGGARGPRRRADITGRSRGRGGGTRPCGGGARDALSGAPGGDPPARRRGPACHGRRARPRTRAPRGEVTHPSRPRRTGGRGAVALAGRDEPRMPGPAAALLAMDRRRGAPRDVRTYGATPGGLHALLDHVCGPETGARRLPHPPGESGAGRRRRGAPPRRRINARPVGG